MLASLQVQPLGPAALLAIWERGTRESAVERGLTLLEFVLPGVPREVLAELSVGQRDALLLSLRELTFGTHAPCIVRCSRCQETLELSLALNDLRVPPPAEAHSVLSVSGRRFSVRAVTSADLLSGSQHVDAEGLANALLDRCVEELDEQGHACKVRKLAPELSEALIAELSRLDPQADIRLQLACVACGEVWSTLFDVLTYLWQELENEARRLLGEVHALARAYGWSEQAILALSRVRRHAYLKLAGAL
jgi:hypothetical protein